MFCQRGSNFDNVLLVDRGERIRIYKRAIIGPPEKRHLNDVPMVAQH